MKVRARGFQLTYHSKINWGTLYTTMLAAANTRFKYQGHERVLLVEQTKSGDILGLLLTDRGHKNFLSMHTTTNALTVGRLRPENHFGAFNFFCLFKKKGSALITTYKDAGGQAFVFGAISRWCREVVTRGRDIAFRHLGSSPTKAAREQVKKTYAGEPLEWTEIVSSERYEEVLKGWEKIKAVDVRCIPADAVPTAFSPQDVSAIESSVQKLAFRDYKATAVALGLIGKLWRWATGPSSEDDAESDARSRGATLRVYGEDDGGCERVVVLADHIPCLFGEMNYDDLIADPSVFGSCLADSAAIKWLMEAARDSPTYFG